MKVALALLMVVLGGACGPSSAQIKTAKTAQYAASSNQILDVAIQVAQRTYKIGDVDPQRGAFATVPQWYSAEGMRRGTSNEGNGDYVNTQGGDVQVSFAVEVVETAPGRVAVTITPDTVQLVAGSPQPRPLTPDDPNLPPWILGRVDTLAVEIYDAAKQFILVR